MTALLWLIGVVLFLALINAIATWLGHDVAEEPEESPEAHAPAHAGRGVHPSPAHAAHSHSPHS